ncbi:MAG: TonB-dependent receptor [Bacteroidetes bacterium]|nr:TonB-dependent receptor [Bacteroidota bacterium]
MRNSGSLIAAFLCSCFLLTSTAFSGEDNKGPFIKGVVIDAKNNAPLVYANIVLRDRATQKFVTSTYSGETGEFLFTAVPAGNYTLTVSYVGYAKKEVMDLAVESDTKQLDLGALAMEEVAVEVGEVTVDADRAPEEFHLDKKVINVSQSLHAKGGSALDVLREQPSVRVDESDNVTLRGSANFTVLVNGRPSAFQGSDALRQIPANLIESIELMTNPSAKYEAEGSAGIINIVMKKEENYSTSGIVNIGAGTRDKYNTDATVNRNMGATKLTGGVDYRKYTFYQVQDVDRLTATAQGDIVNNSDFRRRDIRDQYTLRLGIDHSFDEQHALSLNVNGGQVKIPRSFTFDVHNATPTEDLYQVIRNAFDLTATYYTGTAFYNYSIVPQQSQLSIEGTYTRVTLPYLQHTREYVSDPAFANLGPEPQSTDMDSDVGRHEARAKINYSDKLGEGSTFECGLQTDYSLRNYDVTYSDYDWSGQAWVVDPSLTNAFDLTNQVHAGFATYSNVLMDFQYQVGLRAEYMDRLLTQKTLAEDYAYDKLDWFPSFSLARKIDDHQLQLSYSRRINRPNENLLNPFPFYADRYLITQGNPRLLPEYTHAVELNYQKMYSGVYVSVQTYGRFATNSMWQSMTADSSGRLVTTFGNFAETSTMGAEISASLRPLPWLRLDPNVNLFNYAIKGDAFGDNIDQEAFTWTARLSAICTFGPSTRLQLTGMYLSRQISPQSETDPLFYLSVSARQEFLNKSFSLTLQAQNLLRTAYYEIASTGVNFANNFVIKPEVPIVNLTLTYNFNNYQPVRRPTEGVDVNVGM